MKLLSVVFSFRNEEGNIKELVNRINISLEKLTNWNYELIFVNDDSTDNSESILLELQKKYPNRINKYLSDCAPPASSTEGVGSPEKLPLKDADAQTSRWPGRWLKSYPLVAR